MAERTGFLARFTRCRGGAAAIEFAFILPGVVALTVGLLEFGMVLFDYQRAGEATRRAIRSAIISPPLAALNTIAAADIVCNGGASLTCSTAKASGADTTFGTILTTMQNIFPAIQAQHVRITYSASGLDSTANPGIVTPIVTISLNGIVHPFVVLDIIPGIAHEMTYPEFSTSAVGSSVTVS